MRCQQIQQNIHLFEELTSDEQTQVREHIGGCLPCKEVFDSVQQMNALVRSVSNVDLAPPHASRLTSRIMKSIHVSRQTTGIFTPWVAAIESRWTTWTLSGVSLLLVFMLATEELRPGLEAEMIPSQGVVLDHHVFQQQLLKHRGTRVFKGITTCHSPFRSPQSTADCVRQKYSNQSI